jgi:hypothetical protein
MKDLVSHKIKFQIERQEDDELIVYFEQNSLKYSRLEIIELEEFEYFVGDSPISDTISGHIGLHLRKNENLQSGCSYKVKLHANLVRNQASSDIYRYVDQLLETLNLALINAMPIQIDIRNELEETGWHITCS